MSDVGKSAYLTRRNGSASWYYRRRLPPDVVAKGGRPDFWLSLRTADLRSAQQHIATAEERYWQVVAAARGETNGPSRRAIVLRAKQLAPLPLHGEALTVRAAQQLARTFFDIERARLDQDEPFPNSAIAQSVLEDAAIEAATLRADDHPDAVLWVDEVERQLLSDHGFSEKAEGDAGTLLRSLLKRALVQLVALKAARATGDFADRVTDAFFSANVTPTAAGAKPSPRKDLAALIAEYDRARIEPEVSTLKTKRKARAALEVIKRCLGAEARVQEIDRDACYAFRDTLAALPPNFTKRLGPGAGISALADANKRSGGPTLSRTTQENYLRALSRLFQFAKDQKLVPDNMAENIPIHAQKRRKREQQRNAYSPAQLAKIFNAPLYRGCLNDGRGIYKPGNRQVRDARFWVPLIALFSGLRMNEILQLTPDHIATDVSGPYFRVDDDMEQVKTVNSYRVVPMHPELVRIGLLGFVNGKAEAKAPLLFGDVIPDVDGYRSTRFSKIYARLVKGLGLNEPGRKVTFHSFRHSFRDALRLPDANHDLVRELGGWSRGQDTSTSYGDGASAAALRPLIDRVAYALDLTHLHSASA